ncbi:hypothetical protein YASMINEVIRUS_68 [Yasminevirus sp. GU-2018]|uniref:Uncharacterized protein n=1 Tax=Yasminevirus sp. GU-2018 TaxID=2420051 RepID=A0A5K0U724_9VIRU|nr:hypothetical protein YASMINEVIRUS_68 [Yasminevirus sp. GU-2018]
MELYGLRSGKLSVEAIIQRLDQVLNDQDNTQSHDDYQDESVHTPRTLSIPTHAHIQKPLNESEIFSDDSSDNSSDGSDHDLYDTNDDSGDECDSTLLPKKVDSNEEDQKSVQNLSNDDSQKQTQDKEQERESYQDIINRLRAVVSKRNLTHEEARLLSSAIRESITGKPRTDNSPDKSPEGSQKNEDSSTVISTRTDQEQIPQISPNSDDLKETVDASSSTSTVSVKTQSVSPQTPVSAEPVSQVTQTTQNTTQLIITQTPTVPITGTGMRVDLNQARAFASDEMYDQRVRLKKMIDAIKTGGTGIPKELLLDQVVELYSSLFQTLAYDDYTIRKLLTALYFGTDELTEFCKKLNISQADVLARVRQSKSLKSVTHVIDIFEKFITSYTGGIYAEIKVDRTAEKMYKSLDVYDPSKGVLMIKNKHIDPCATTYADSNASLYGYRQHRVRAHDFGKQLDYNRACKCLSCLTIGVVNSSFVEDMKILMTDDPFKNILRFEKYLFTVMNSGVLKDQFERSDYFIESPLEAVSYIDHVKTKVLTCSKQTCFEYFSEFAKKKIRNVTSKLTSDYKVIPHIVSRDSLTDISEGERAEYLSEMDLDVAISGKFSRFVERTRGGSPDNNGVSLNTLWMLSQGDRMFKGLLNNMTEMLGMSTHLPLEWCTVDTYPTLKRDDLSTHDPANFNLTANHNTFVNFMHTSIMWRLSAYLSTKGYIKFNTTHEDIVDPTNTKSLIREFYNSHNAHHSKNRDLITTAINIRNPYGTLNHEFIELVMDQYKVPDPIKNYILNFYSNLKVRVLVNGEYTDYFQMERGLLHGDDMSNIVFIMCITFINNILADKFRKNKPADVPDMFGTFGNSVFFHTSDVATTRSVIESFIRLNYHLKTGFDMSFEKSYTLATGPVSSDLKKGVEIVIGKVKKIVRALDDDEIARYSESYVSVFEENEIVSLETLNHEIIEDFKFAESEMVKKGLLAQSKAKNRNSKTKTCINVVDMSDLPPLCSADDNLSRNDRLGNIEQLRRIGREQLRRIGRAGMQLLHDEESYSDEDDDDILSLYRNRCRPTKKVTVSTFDERRKTVQKIYTAILEKIEWRLSRSIMTVDKMNDLIVRLDTIAKHYSERWDVSYTQTTAQKTRFLSVKNTVLTILHKDNPRFVDAINKKVAELYNRSGLVVNRLGLIQDTVYYR